MTELEWLFVHSEPLPWSGCWIFEAGSLVSKKGYRYAYHNRLAHRLSYAVAVGEIPRFAQVHHSCNIPDCVNPQHLSVVTSKEHGEAHRKELCGKGHSFTVHGYFHKGKRYCRACRTEAAYNRRHVDGAGYAAVAGEIAERTRD